MMAAVAALERSQFVEAEKIFTEILTEKGEPVEALIHRAFCRLRAKSFETALEDATKSVSLRPENGVFWMIQGEILLEMGRYQNALESLEKACELEADNGRALYQRGRALLKLNRQMEAADFFEQALQFERDYVLAQQMTHG